MNDRWRSVGEQVQDNYHLNRLLLAIAPAVREEFYEAIRPYLKFEPKPSFSFADSPR